MAIYELNKIQPKLGANVYVAPTGAVIGDVEIGDDSSIWFGAVLRGDCFPIRIGARTNIQDNAVVHTTGGKAMTTVGDDVTVGHLALLHGCKVGSRCLIGMGSILLDGCEIGDESMVAAGTLVTPGKKFPPRSMIMGRPGVVVRTLSDAEFAHIRDAGQFYLGYAADCRDSLVELAP